MGLGDQLIGTGLARGARARGKRIAFGDKRRIIWDQNSAAIFSGNPNIARPGSERDKDIQWIGYYKGSRIYNTQDMPHNRWVWNYDFKPIPGEVFFTRLERRNAERFGKGFVIIEPNVESWKSCAPNKDWGRKRYQRVADALLQAGYRVGQFEYPRSGPALDGVERFKTMSFRDGLAIMAKSVLYVGAEGGLHHGAAAVGKPAVVLFGGFVPPAVTGYPNHANLTGGAEACGSLKPCPHCKAAMAKISVEEVLIACQDRL